MPNIKTVANQKTIRIAERIKRSKESPDNYYATINLNALKLAMSSGLSETALKMWLYLDKNQDGYEFALSQKACLEWGICKTSYYKAVEELIKRGYLVPANEKESSFLFVEVPRSQKGKDQDIVLEVCSELEQTKLQSKLSFPHPEQNCSQENREIIYNTNKNTKEKTGLELQAEFDAMWYA